MSGSAYQNYADPALHGRREACHGPNPPRLEAVRRTYDPGRLFRFPQAIRAGGPGPFSGHVRDEDEWELHECDAR
ncbi:BBE domain-containing protein [Streptomyces goshikiensis]|uniref:BBE domain-containing protein n=1 Tax=Streptomyces goshikiensis TaxID=1942 RepID=UPI00367DC9D1